MCEIWRARARPDLVQVVGESPTSPVIRIYVHIYGSFFALSHAFRQTSAFFAQQVYVANAQQNPPETPEGFGGAAQEAFIFFDTFTAAAILSGADHFGFARSTLTDRLSSRFIIGSAIQNTKCRLIHLMRWRMKSDCLDSSLFSQLIPYCSTSVDSSEYRFTPRPSLSPSISTPIAASIVGKSSNVLY